MRKSSTNKRTSKKSATVNKKTTGKSRRLWRASGGVVALLVLISVLGFTHHAGPLNAVFNLVSNAAPLVQQDTTKLNTADGLASSSSILVKFRASASPATIAAIHQANHATVKRVLPDIGVQEVILPNGTDIGAALKQYRAQAAVQYAEPNPIAQRFMTPNDTLYSKQWNLAKINASAAWDVSQGGYGPIAIVDTGIDASHSDLSGEIEPGYNFVNNSTDTSDDNGHGTSVAGIIAGITNNSNGVASIGFKGSLIPVKVLDSTGTGTYGDVASGIIYAADNGAKIINLSLGGSSPSQTLQSAVNYAEQKGVIVVAAAGNNGNSAAVYPADYPGVIAVSATDTNDNLASFSSYGSDIVASAPGVGIISTYNNGGYATMSGTSMAAPEVAGLLGLALSHSQVSTATLLSDLEQSSDKVGPYPYNSSGWNEYFGYGRIDAAKLLQLIGSTASTPTAPSTTTSTANGQTIHGQPSLQFSVDFEGTVDSVNQTRGVVTVKIQSISQNLKLADNNLIDVYISGSTTLTANGQNSSLATIAPGDKIGGKALWQNNQLAATNITVQSQPSTTPSPNSSSASTTQSQAGQAHRP